MNAWSVAAFVVSLIATTAAVICARSAVRSWKASVTGSTAHGLTSLRVEMAELRDSVQKLAVLGKRQEQRAIMQQRRATTVTTDDEPLSAKDELRRRAGLIAGKPAPHS